MKPSPYQPEERSDSRPRADRYNRAVYEYVLALEGEAKAAIALQKLQSQQEKLGITNLMRLDRDDDHMPGFPVIDTSEICRAMASEVRSFDWFKNVGRYQPENGYVPVPSWDDAIKELRSACWENYTLDARDEITVSIQRRSQIVLDVLYNEVVYSIERIFTESVGEAIAGAYGGKEQWRDKVVSEVLIMISGACVEEHWSKFAGYEHRVYRRMYDILHMGHLPCGAIGKYPQVQFKVF